MAVPSPTAEPCEPVDAETSSARPPELSLPVVELATVEAEALTPRRAAQCGAGGDEALEPDLDQDLRDLDLGGEVDAGGEVEACAPCVLDPPPCSCMLDHNAVLKHFDYKHVDEGATCLLASPPAHVGKQAELALEVEPCGVTTLGQRLWKQRPSRRIGTMVPSNSGRPGGACANQLGSNEARTPRAGQGQEDDEPVKLGSLHADHAAGCEEDLVSNWLLTAARNADESLSTARCAGGEAGVHCMSTFAKSVHGEWGLLDPTGCNPIARHLTAQRVDYTDDDLPPSSYADAWVVEGVRLSAKVSRSVGERKLPSRFDTSSQYPTALVFVAGPSAFEGAEDDENDPWNAAARTYSRVAAHDYGHFRAGVKAAVRAGLHAMAMRGCDVALLGRVSGGKEAGAWAEELRADYAALVREVLAETNAQTQPRPLGCWFEKVVLCDGA